MRCSSRVTVYHLKRFLLGKLSVPPLYDVSCSGGESAFRPAKYTYMYTLKCFVYSLSLESLTTPFCSTGCTASHCFVGDVYDTISCSTAEGSSLVLEITSPPTLSPHPRNAHARIPSKLFFHVFCNAFLPQVASGPNLSLIWCPCSILTGWMC